jgi:predicted nucleotidyltransferase
MAIKIEELLRSKRQEILAIAARHGAHNVRVFGSVARGEAKPDSDVDILVEMELGTSLMDHVTLMQDLETSWKERWTWSAREPCTGISGTEFLQRQLLYEGRTEVPRKRNRICFPEKPLAGAASWHFGKR